MSSLTTKEIAKVIRGELKAEFPGNKFSVRTEYFSGGSSITVSLMRADRKVRMDFDRIPKDAIRRYTERDYSPYSVDGLRRLQGEDYHQLADNGFYRDYDEHWNNGVFLTYQGYLLLKRVVQIVDRYHRVDSDIMTDYYNTNFYFHLQLGRYDRPFQDGAGFVDDPALVSRIEERQREVKAATERAKREKAEKDKLDHLENSSHVAKSRRTVNEIKDIMRSTAIIGANGLEVLTAEVKAKKILEINEVRQALKVKGIDWSKVIFEI